MIRTLYIYLHFIIVGYLSFTATALKCFNCESHVNPACGAYFKAYQFKAENCDGTNFKCALQRQPARPDGWIGIVRICYQIGTLPGMNETNGCRKFTNEDNGYTAYYCFCDTDYCNTSTTLTGHISVFIAMFVMCLLLS